MKTEVSYSEGGCHPGGCSYCRGRIDGSCCKPEEEMVIVHWSCQLCGHNHAYQVSAKNEIGFRENLEAFCIN